MASDLEERALTLEQEMAGLRRQLSMSGVKKDWRKTVGTSKDDPGFVEMIELGRQIRQQDREDET